MPSQLLQFSSLLEDKGDMELEQSSDPCNSSLLLGISGVDWRGAVFLCFILVCCFSPFSEAAMYSHWSHLGVTEAVSSPLDSVVGDVCYFLAKNSFLRLAFLRSVEGLAFFFWDWLLVFTALLLVSREKEKPEPVEMEMLKS